MPTGAANLLPYQSHWLQFQGARMHYLDEGPRNSGETLLFVHGNPTWSYHWRRLIEQFRDAKRCVAMDHLGMGASDLPRTPQRLANHIDHVTRLVDELDLRNVTLVAQDWGGAIGLGSLLERRERFNRIVLFNTGAFPPPFIPRRIAACRIPLLGRLGVQGLNLFSRAALRMTLARAARLEPEVAKAYLAPFNSWRNRRAVYDFVADIPLKQSHPTWQVLDQMESQLVEINLPTCLIWGMKDWCFTPDECLERFLLYWPHAESHRLADVGHWVVEDAPDEAAKLVAQFLQRTSLTGLPQ